ncbi:MAG: hypothetical protein LWY06_01425 [Firmicutes bacterium]|nr:hypothetical protein [Bacillota bacterium]
MELYLVIYFFVVLTGIVYGAEKGQLASGIVWTILLGPLGILVVALLPNLKDIIKCPFCKGDAVRGASKCKNCGSSISVIMDS